MDPNTGVGNPTPAYTYGLFLAEVEVDTATGKTTILRYTSVDDVGVVGNPTSVDGQAYGGLSHCMGFALSENYDDVEKHANIWRRHSHHQGHSDDFNVIHLENLRSTNPYGSSGASEAFQSSGHMAVINAINNACGVRIYELPARPEKVKEGIEKLARGEEILPPKKYFLGSDFEEEMENIKNNPVEG